MISFVFSTWNSRTQIEKCLESLRWLNKKEIIIVDQGSTDGTVEFLKQQENIRVVYEDKKTSWADANRKGIMFASQGWIAVSNPDVYYSPDFRKVLDYIRDMDVRNIDGRIKPIISCQLELENGTIQSPVRNLNFWNLLAKSMSIGHLLDLLLFQGRNSRDFYYYENWKGSETKMIVEHPFMSFFIFHKSILEIIGKLWGRAYTWSRADSDFCKRVALYKIPIVLLPVKLKHDFAHSFKTSSRYSMEADWAYGNVIFSRYWDLNPRLLTLLYLLNLVIQPIVQMRKASLPSLILRMAGQAKGILIAWRQPL